MADAPTTAYTEVQIDDDSISLTLISESGSNGPVIEDTERFTFEELEDMAGEHLTLRLSADSRDALVDQREQATVKQLLEAESLDERAEIIGENPSTDELLAYMGLLGGEVAGEPTGEDPDGSIDVATGQQETTYNLPEVADVLVDTNPADWSDDDRVRVVEVTDTPSDEYVIQESEFGRDKTVADANPSEPADAPVVVANYVGSVKEYAFPVTRLKPVDEVRGAVPHGQEKQGL